MLVIFSPNFCYFFLCSALRKERTASKYPKDTKAKQHLEWKFVLRPSSLVWTWPMLGSCNAGLVQLCDPFNSTMHLAAAPWHSSSQEIWLSRQVPVLGPAGAAGCYLHFRNEHGAVYSIVLQTALHVLSLPFGLPSCMVLFPVRCGTQGSMAYSRLPFVSEGSTVRACF